MNGLIDQVEFPVKNKLRIILVGLAAALVLGIITLMAFVYGRSTTFPPLPNPNGYDDFLQAGALLSGQVGDFRDMSHEDLQALVATNGKSLTLVRSGLKKQCALPTQTYLLNSAAMSADLPLLKQIAQLLAAEGRLAELDGRLDDAAQSYLDAMRFGNELSRNGFVINRLVGIACSAIGSIPLAKLTPKLECEQLKPIIAELDELDHASVTWQEVWRAESIFMRHELRKIPNPVAWVPQWWQARKVVQSSEANHLKAAARLRLLETEVALRCYRDKQGLPPAQLTQLVPQYLQRLPQDPFNTQPLVYRAQGTNWLLYSIGPDGKDDGGTPAGRGTSGKGDLLFDSAW
jgi:hypothetical protein